MISLRFGCHALGIGLAVAMLAGCGGSQSAINGAVPMYRTNTPSSKATYDELLYVANFSGSVATYDLQTYGSSNNPIRTISQPQPVALAFNQQGYLFVATQWWASTSSEKQASKPKSGFVAIYEPGSTKLRQTITDGLSGPRALAFDSSGNLYVANSGGNGNYVTVYSAPKYKLTATVDQGANEVLTLALDKSENLYVGNRSSITVYAHGTLQLIRTITNGINCPNTLAFDRQDRLYVANYVGGCGDSVTIYAANSTNLFVSITVRN